MFYLSKNPGSRKVIEVFYLGGDQVALDKNISALHFVVVAYCSK